MWNTWIEQMARARAHEQITGMYALSWDECARLEDLARRVERGDYTQDRTTPTHLRLEFIRWLVEHDRIADSGPQMGKTAPKRVRLSDYTGAA